MALLLVMGATTLAQNQPYFAPPANTEGNVAPMYRAPAAAAQPYPNTAQPNPNTAQPYPNTAQPFPATSPAAPQFPATQPAPGAPATAPAAPIFGAPDLGAPSPAPAMTPAPRSTTMSVDPNFQRNPLGDTQLQVAPAITTWGEFTSAQIIARVGGETILAGDILGPVMRTLEPYRDQMSAEQFEVEKMKLMKMFLDQTIETQIVYADAMAKFPKENLAKMHDAVNEQFEKNIVKNMMERSNAANRADLEKKLAETGSSLEKQNKVFFQRSIAAQWMKQNIKTPSEIPLADVLAYYKNHQADYEYKAKVRWEELMISYDKTTDKNLAYQQIAELGNQILRGASFAELAKTNSHAISAENGGKWDWTTEGSLRSVITDQAIHSLPVNQMSQILQDTDGLRIVRVIERKPAGRIPFEEAQPEIKKKLLEDAEKKSEDEYLAAVKQRVPVWTIFEGQIDPETLSVKGGAPKKR